MAEVEKEGKGEENEVKDDFNEYKNEEKWKRSIQWRKGRKKERVRK